MASFQSVSSVVRLSAAGQPGCIGACVCMCVCVVCPRCVWVPYQVVLAQRG